MSIMLSRVFRTLPGRSGSCCGVFFLNLALQVFAPTSTLPEFRSTACARVRLFNCPLPGDLSHRPVCRKRVPRQATPPLDDQAEPYVVGVSSSSPTCPGGLRPLREPGADELG